MTNIKSYPTKWKWGKSRGSFKEMKTDTKNFDIVEQYKLHTKAKKDIMLSIKKHNY